MADDSFPSCTVTRLPKLGVEDIVPRNKLLLADDSVTIRKVVKLTFEDEGIDVIDVPDGDSAWQQLQSEIPDVVLADVHMPGLDGYELCRRIREGATTAALPVLLLVGSFESFDESRAAAAGATGHMTKPFQSIRQLVAQVKELLGQAKDAAAFENTIPAEGTVEETDQAERSSANTEPLSPEIADTSRKAVDTSDIDSLYDESLEPIMELPVAVAGNEELGDVSTDDLLIETGSDGPTLEVPNVSIGNQEEKLGGEEHSVEYLPEAAATNSGSPYSYVTNHGSDYPDSSAQTEPLSDSGNILDIPAFDAKPIDPPLPAPAKSSAAAVSLSPEQIELIVQKVIERLEEKYDRGPESAFR